MNLASKSDIIAAIASVCEEGWIPSVKETVDTRNDGAVGNTLEARLGLTENNLPIPNANEWELKGQRKHTASLVTLKHLEPSPRALRLVPRVLLPLYGWPHAKAGTRYPAGEMSFRSTTSAAAHTSRGFIVLVDRSARKIRLQFDADKVDTQDEAIREWLEEVEKRVGKGPLDPEPYWGFDDLERQMAAKLGNCLYVVADSKVENGREYFRYEELLVLSRFSFPRFLEAVECGHVLVDFDARTGHNHGTKFRLRQDKWPDLYEHLERVI